MNSDAIRPPDQPAHDDPATHPPVGIDVGQPAAVEQALRAAAGELGAAGVVDVESAPPTALRERILAAARARRAPSSPADLSPADLHRIELSRAITTLRHLVAGRWDRRLDPPELAGWTVHDAVVHLAANEAMLAQALGLGLPSVPETETTNEPRTALARARHLGLAPTRALDELEEAAAIVDAHVSVLTPDGFDHTIEFWGGDTTVTGALYTRSFETWTHTDDVRRAIGVAEAPPPPAVMRQLCRAAVTIVPHMLRARGTDPPSQLVRFHLDGPGAASWDLRLPDGVAEPAGPAEPDTVLTVGTVALCRGVSARVPTGGLAYTSRGDTGLAARIIEALPAFATV
jgi:uncharacterized protein (TIGR03083 family)